MGPEAIKVYRIQRIQPDVSWTSSAADNVQIFKDVLHEKLLFPVPIEDELLCYKIDVQDLIRYGEQTGLILSFDMISGYLHCYNVNCLVIWFGLSSSTTLVSSRVCWWPM